jgi:hypothetical protein
MASELMMFDGGKVIEMGERGFQSGLAQLERRNKQRVGEVLASGDLQAGAKAAYGYGDVEGGSRLMQLYGQQQEQIAQQQQAQMKADRERQIGQAMAGVLSPDLGGLAQLDPSLAASVYGSRQRTAQQAQPAPFTLAPGTTRYNGDGNPIATAPAKPPAKKERALTSVDKNAILEADDQVQMGKNTIDMLNQALSLNDKAGSGYTAGAQSFAARNDPTGFFDDEKGAATTEFNNIVMGQALSSMKAIFGGNPTEGERAVLLQLQGAADKSPQERKLILQRGIALAQRRVMFNEERAKQVRSGEYFGEASNVEAVPQVEAGAYQGADGVTSQDLGGGVDQQFGSIEQGAIEELTADTSPQARAEFDAVFGEGASAYVLGQ